MRRTIPMIVATAVAWALPAGASTLPEVGLKQGELAATAGFLDVGIDLGLTDRWQLGIGTYGTLLDTSRYVRTTLRVLGDDRSGALGLHLAFGTNEPLLIKGSASNTFALPGVAFTRPLGEAFVLRGSLGVLFNTLHGPQLRTSPQGILENPYEGSWSVGRDDRWASPLELLVPNLELAWRLGGSSELTFGGNAIIGWRARFKQL